MRLRFQNQGGNRTAYLYGYLLGTTSRRILLPRNWLSGALDYVVDHIVKPDGKIDGVQIPSRGSEACHGFQHGSDVIERMVEAARLGVMLAYLLEHLVGQRWRHGPGAKEIVPILSHHITHVQFSPEPSRAWCPAILKPWAIVSYSTEKRRCTMVPHEIVERRFFSSR